MSGYIGTTPVPQATQHREAFTANANQTTFATAGYTVGYIDVWVNGVKLAAADVTVTNGSDIVLASAAAANDIVEYLAFVPFEAVNQTFTGATVVNSLNLNGDGATVTGIKDEDNMASNDANKLATQQSIKAYVDATVGATNEVVEDTTPQLGGDLASNGNDILMADNDKARFGADSDLQIYHDGSNSYVNDNGTGDLVLKTAGAGVQMWGGGDVMLNAVKDGAVTLYHDNAAKLATTSTGIDVTGTVTATGVTVGNSSIGSNTSHLANLTINNNSYIGSVNATSAIQIATSGAVTFGGSVTASGAIHAQNDSTIFKATNSGNPALTIGSSATNGLMVQSIFHSGAQTLNQVVLRTFSSHGGANAGKMIFGVDEIDKLEINDSGVDVTGTVTATGGTIQSDTATFRIQSNTTATKGVSLGYNHSSSTATLLADHQGVNQLDMNYYALSHTFGRSSSLEFLTIDSSGNVGIGESVPLGKLHVKTSDSGATADVSADEFVIESSSNTGMTILSSATGSGSIYFGDSGTNWDGYIAYSQNTRSMSFGTAAGGRMMIDSTGNALVGKTSQDLSTEGISINPLGYIQVTESASPTLYLNRLSTDGSIVNFYKDGTAVGSIGAQSGDLNIGTTNCGLLFNDGTPIIIPTNVSTNAVANGTIDLGYSAGRFKDLHLSGVANVGSVLQTVSSTGLAGSFANTHASGYGLRVTTYGTGAQYGFAVDSYGGGYSRDFTVGADGNVNVLTGNLVIGTAGKGIDFSAQTATATGTTTSELLDSYEEGTWTPGITINDATNSVAYNYQNAGYIKVGGHVTIWARLGMTTKPTSTSGYVKITGLPFTNNNNAGRSEAATANFNYWANFSNSPTPSGYVQQNATTILLMRHNGANASVPMPYNDITNTSLVYFTATYSTV